MGDEGDFSKNYRGTTRGLRTTIRENASPINTLTLYDISFLRDIPDITYRVYQKAWARFITSASYSKSHRAQDYEHV